MHFAAYLFHKRHIIHSICMSFTAALYHKPITVPEQYCISERNRLDNPTSSFWNMEWRMMSCLYFYLSTYRCFYLLFDGFLYPRMSGNHTALFLSKVSFVAYLVIMGLDWFDGQFGRLWGLFSIINHLAQL